MLRARSPGNYCLDCDSQLVKRDNRWYCSDCRSYPSPTRIMGVAGKKVDVTPANEQSGDFLKTFR